MKSVILQNKTTLLFDAYWLLILVFLAVSPFFVQAQIIPNNTLSPTQLVQNVLMGGGVQVSNISYSGSALSIGSFTNGNSSNIGMDEGVIISTGNIMHLVGPNAAQNTQTNTLGGSDPQLATLIPGYSVYDAAVLQFDFVPMSDTIRIQYVFASEEYEEWVGSPYNDVFGFFVSGTNPSGGNYINTNLAKIPNTNTIVSVNTVNDGAFGLGPCTNCTYFINNNSGTTIEFDGFTVVLSAWLVVVPCTNYHIKLAIGDGGDHSYDSGVFLKKNSFGSNILKVNHLYADTAIHATVEGCNQSTVSFTLNNASPYNRWVNYTIGGTATNGVDYTTIPDSILIPVGTDSVSLVIDPILDGISEGNEYLQLIVETSFCANDTIIIPIHNYNLPSVQINGVNSLCSGLSTSLTSTVTNGYGPFTYNWNGLSTQSNITIHPTSSTQYPLQMTDACGISVVDTHSLTVYSKPVITASSNYSAVCFGDTAVLSVIGANTYQWSPASSLSNSYADTVNAFPSNTTLYTVIGTDIHACKDTATVNLIIKPLPILQINSSSTNLCISDSLLLSANGANTYTWSPQNSLSSATASSVFASPTTTTTYHLVGTGANGCTDSITQLITVYNLPNVQINLDSASACLGISKQFIASGANNYQWSPAIGLSSTNTATVNASPPSTTTYVVVGTDAHQCKDSDTVNLQIYNYPSVSVSPSKDTICGGTSTSLTASGATNYSWIPATGLSTVSGNLVLASPNASINYVVTGSNAYGCSDTAIAKIIVSPIMNTTAVDPIICIGDSTLLTVSANLQGTTYSWSNGANTNSTYVAPLVNSNYTITATDPNGCTGTDSVLVTVKPLPTITISPNIHSLCIGSSKTVTASGAISYVWTPNTNISSSTNATTTLSPTVNTAYTVVGTDAFGCKNSKILNININPLPTVQVSPNNVTMCYGSGTTLTASGAATYQWSPTLGLSAFTGAVVSANPMNNTNYIVTGTDINGCKNTATAVVTLNPTIQIVANPPEVCLGDSTLLHVSSNVPATYLWSNGSTQASIWVSPSLTSIYTVTATTTTACSRTSSISILVHPKPIVTISPAVGSICAGKTASLTASGATTYNWQANASLSSLTGSQVTATPGSTTSYLVIGTDLGTGCSDTATALINVYPGITVGISPTQDSICQGETANLQSTGAPNYVWSPAIGLSTTSGNSVYASPNATKTYQVLGINANGCRDSASMTLVVHAKPNLQITDDTSHLCIGKSIPIQASGAYSYTWTPALGLSSTIGSNVTANPLVNSTYTIIGTSQIGGCKDTAIAYVGVHPYPILTLNPTAIQICPNDSTPLQAGGADYYHWTPAQGLSSNSQALVNASPDSTQTYQVVGSSVFGCTDTLATTVTVRPVPVIHGDGVICFGDSSILSVVTNSIGANYLWSNGSSSNQITVYPSITTTYTVTATDLMSGCTKDTSFVVHVNPLPTLAISPADSSICYGDSILLTASGASSYQWSPGIGLSATNSPTVIASPLVNTTYTLIGITPAGCRDTIQTTLGIYSLPTISVSPNSVYNCAGTNLLLTASGGLSYSWSPATGLSSTTGANVNALPSSNTNYTVTGYDIHQCADTAIAHVKIYGNPVINPTNPWMCPGDTILLSTYTQNPVISYLWSNGDTTQQTSVSSFNASTYAVTVTYPGSCVKTSSSTVNIYNDPTVNANAITPFICVGDSAQLSGSNCASYTWSGLNLIDSLGNIAIANPSINASYVVRGVSAHGCITYDTTSVSMFPLANINIISAPSIVCDNDTALLIADGGISYTWNPAIVSSSQSGDSAIAVPMTSKWYFVQGTDGNGCRAIDSSYIDVYPDPIVSITPSIPCVCQGDTIQLIADGGIAYQWSPNYAILGSNNDTVNVYPLANTYYYVHVTDSLGCSKDTSVYVTAKRKPILGVLPSLASICLGDSILIEAFGASTYTWTPHNSLSDSVGSFVTATPSLSTTYLLTGTSTDGCYKTISSTILVNPLPHLQIASTDSLICAGNYVGLNGSSSLNPTQMIWSTGDTAISTADHPLVTTTYQLKGISSFGCEDSISHVIQVNPYPQINLSPLDTIICTGDSIPIVSTCNLSNMSYLWSNGNVNSTIIVNPSVDSSYTLIVSDSIGCSDTLSSTVNLQTVPSVNISANSNHVCANDSVILHGTTSLPVVLYQWNTMNLGPTNIQFPTVNTTYSLTVTDSIGCQDQDSFSVIVNPLPVLQLTPTNNPICIGDTTEIQVQSNVNPVTFYWTYNASTASNISVNPSISTIYTVIAQDSMGCTDSNNINIQVNNLPQLSINPNPTKICTGDSVQFSLTSNITIGQYSWSNGSTLATPYFSPLINSTVWVTATDVNGCINSSSRNVSVYPNPLVDINPPIDTICSQDSLQLVVSANHPAQLINWNTGLTVNNPYYSPNVTTSYSVIFTDTNGCKGYDTATIHVIPRPIGVILTSSPICHFDTCSAVYQGNAGLTAIINWDFGSANVLTGSGFNPYLIQWNGAGNYPLIMSVTENGCTSFPDTTIVTVNESPSPYFFSTDTSVCASTKVNFTSIPNGMTSYFWTFGDSSALGADTSDLQNASYTYYNSGIYDVKLKVISPNGCKGSYTQNSYIEILPKPIANFIADPEISFSNSQAIHFQDLSTDASFWEWDFGDITSGGYNFSILQNPNHIYQLKGDFFPSLIVRNLVGCTDTISKQVSIKNSPVFYIPDAFTPNGDGLNDQFIHSSHDFEESSFEMYIYSRWGDLVFETQDIHLYWNGKHYQTSEELPDEVYSYIIFISDLYGDRHKFTGGITLYR